MWLIWTYTWMTQLYMWLHELTMKVVGLLINLHQRHSSFIFAHKIDQLWKNKYLRLALLISQFGLALLSSWFPYLISLWVLLPKEIKLVWEYFFTNNYLDQYKFMLVSSYQGWTQTERRTLNMTQLVLVLIVPCGIWVVCQSKKYYEG